MTRILESDDQYSDLVSEGPYDHLVALFINNVRHNICNETIVSSSHGSQSIINKLVLDPGDCNKLLISVTHSRDEEDKKSMLLLFILSDIRIALKPT